MAAEVKHDVILMAVHDCVIVEENPVDSEWIIWLFGSRNKVSSIWSPYIYTTKDLGVILKDEYAMKQNMVASQRN